jgi:crossover junction endodeoxyribonuclease RuvC
MTPAHRGIPTFEYTANKIKKSLVGAGHADKKQIQVMVRHLMPAAEITGPDVADALAVAITHAHHRETDRRIQEAKK